MSENPTYKVGKGKPPLNRRFGQPEGNPNGKTSEQKRLEMSTAEAALRNAEAAIRIRERILRAAEARLVELSTEEVLSEFVEAAMLKLLTDSETRGLGAPVQPVDHTSKGESLNPQAAIKAALERKHRDA